MHTQTIFIFFHLLPASAVLIFHSSIFLYSEYVYSYDLTLVFVLQNRAQAATELLQELNSDVSGNFVEEVGIV